MKDSLLCGADFGPNVYAQNSNPEVFKVVENDKNALGIIGVSWVSADMKAQSLSVVHIRCFAAYMPHAPV